MADFFKNLSKNALAAIIIGAGVLLIVASDPPVTKCSHQIKKFEESQVGFLTKDKTAKFQDKTRYEKLLGICRSSNNLGGCYEFFNSVAASLEKGRTISLDCQSDWGNTASMKTLLNDSLQILIELPWGASGPSSDLKKLGWFKAPQIELFCQLQNVYALVNGDAAWAQKREALLSSLPNYQTLGREKAWGMSLLSVNCSRYRRGSF